MKKLLQVLLVLALLSASGAPARAADLIPVHVTFTGVDAPARWAARHDSRDARMAITSREGDVTLLLTDEVVAIQFSDRCMHELRRKMREDEDRQDNAVARALASAVLSGVRSLLDHSAECPVRALRAAAYEDGRLVFTATDGRHVLEGLIVDDHDVLAGFDEADAQRFARECGRLVRQKR